MMLGTTNIKLKTFWPQSVYSRTTMSDLLQSTQSHVLQGSVMMLVAFNGACYKKYHQQKF